MKSVLKPRRFIVFVHDLLATSAAWLLAILVRHNFDVTTLLEPSVARSLGVVLVIQSVIYGWFGLYKGLWRFASTRDLWNIIRAVFAGTLTISIILFLFNRLDAIPRSVLLLYPIFLTFLLGGPRLTYRFFKDKNFHLTKEEHAPKQSLIIGAGRAGEMLARDMLRSHDYLPLGFLDDDPSLKGSKIHGIPVLGKVSELKKWAEKLEADLVVIALPSATSAQMRKVVAECENSGIAFRTLPPLINLENNHLSTDSIREVSLEDLLGREPVSLDWGNISKNIIAKSILVTGGGGSIGSELCRQIARLGPSALIILEHSEFNLYQIERELKQQFPNTPLHPCLGNICDTATVEHVFAQHRPDIVFHAAAYKHVPILESHIREAMLNNVIGTQVVAEAANKWGSEAFVMISTDKAVNPANILGASKRIAEIFCQNLNYRSKTRFMTVRFGNVLGSAGSVIPLFKEQIAQGGPVTVTHKDITRYFMTIPEACQLILQAATMGRGGEIFVLDMGEPVKISYLAEQLIRLSGKTPGKDIEIIYTGLRPGEKLYEELFYDQESMLPTEHEKILLANSRKVDWPLLQLSINNINAACLCYDTKALLEETERLVPENQFKVKTTSPEYKVVKII